MMQTSPWTFFLAFVLVLALIGGGAFLVRRFAGNRIGTSANRGRMPRLAVIDAAAVDGRRRLVLVRRDNVEHLLMIGGPTDIVVEPNIVRAVAQREQPPGRGPVGAELPPRVALPDQPAWPETSDAPDFSEPMPELPPTRPMRSAFPDDGRRSPVQNERRGPDISGSLAPDLPGRAEPRVEARFEPPLRSPPPRDPIPPVRDNAPREPQMPRPARTEPVMPRPARPLDAAPTRIPSARPADRPAAPALPSASSSQPSPAAMSAADQNLAEMAQRLEAALRRPAEPRAEANPVDRVGAPPVAPDGPAARPSTPDVPANPRSKAPFENLEDEMASLLGRPKPPS